MSFYKAETVSLYNKGRPGFFSIFMLKRCHFLCVLTSTVFQNERWHQRREAGVIAWSMKNLERAAADLCNTTASMRAALSGLLEGQVNIAIQALADIAQNGASEAARVLAAYAILDRTHGRPCASPDAASLHGLPDNPLCGFLEN
jgi:hypothetical protein